jgi:hypothetical protein
MFSALVAFMQYVYRENRKREHEWHRGRLGWTTMRRRLPSGAFEYREETEQEALDQHDATTL